MVHQHSCTSPLLGYPSCHSRCRKLRTTSNKYVRKARLTMRWNLLPLYPCGRPKWFFDSPVQNCRKFSAVLGTTSAKSSNFMRPSFSPTVLISMAYGSASGGQGSKMKLHSSRAHSKSSNGHVVAGSVLARSKKTPKWIWHEGRR